MPTDIELREIARKLRIFFLTLFNSDDTVYIYAKLRPDRMEYYRPTQKNCRNAVCSANNRARCCVFPCTGAGAGAVGCPLRARTRSDADPFNQSRDCSGNCSSSTIWATRYSTVLSRSRALSGLGERCDSSDTSYWSATRVPLLNRRQRWSRLSPISPPLRGPVISLSTPSSDSTHTSGTRTLKDGWRYVRFGADTRC